MTSPAPQADRHGSDRDAIAIGATVYGKDNARFGQVAGSYRSYLIVERGFFMPIDYYVPIKAVGRVDGDVVVLSVSRDVALRQGWERPPFTSETGQRPAQRPAVGGSGVAAARPAGAAAREQGSRSWPTGDVPRPDAAAAGATSATSSGQPTDQPATTTPAPETLTTPPAPAEVPRPPASVAAYADTYAVGTNTDSYRALDDYVPVENSSPEPTPAAANSQPHTQAAPASTSSGSSAAPADTTPDASGTPDSGSPPRLATDD